MKTNYLNAKQQMAALTLGIACLFSIAWINPTEKKKEKVKTNKVQIYSIRNTNTNLNTLVCLDTTKKRKIKIVTIDANGKKTEYNSVKEMPDSLRKDFYRDELLQGNRVFKFRADSAFHFKDSLLHARLYREFNSPEAKLKWKKFGEDMDKEFNSPEAKAKWKKMGEDMAKEFNSPEAQAKWKKMAEDMQKKMNSPEEQAKWKKFGEDMEKEFNSPEAKAKWKKMAEDMTKEFSSPEAQAKWRKMSDDIVVKINSGVRAQIDGAKMRALSNDLRKLEGKRFHIDSLRTHLRYDSSEPRVLYFEDNNSKKLRESPEYKKIREKYEQEIKELKEKIEKKEKKEKQEN